MTKREKEIEKCLASVPETERKGMKAIFDFFKEEEKKLRKREREADQEYYRKKANHTNG